MFRAGWRRRRMVRSGPGLPRGLYAVTPEPIRGPNSRVDAGAADSRLLAQVNGCLRGGASIVQYRDKVSNPKQRRALASAINDLCRQHAAVFIVNDDIDLALEIGADGVHLGEADLACAPARARAGGNLLIGVSCYDSLPRARRALEDGASYVAFGSAFPSPTKPAAVLAPLSLYQQAARELAIPVVAIGGITTDNAPLLVSAGCHALAVISSLFDAADTVATARVFSQLFETSAPDDRLE